MNEAPLVTVIVTNHLSENRPYLDLCLKALHEQVGISFEAIVLSDAETCPDVPSEFTLVHNRDLNTATKKVHFGISMSDPRSRYFLLLSDDVVLHKDCLRSLVQGILGHDAICNPMSNSDNGTRFLTLSHPGPDLDLADYVECEPCSQSLLVPQDWLSFYCTLIPRAVWERVGMLDEALEVRGNDVDYCTRAAKVGVGRFINFGAFAFHFGSKTLRKTVTPEMYAEADQSMAKKYGDGR